MPLSVADIDRWSAEAVREVFHAAGARAGNTFEVSRQLGSLAVFHTWQGQARKAAEHQNGAIRQDLDAHGNEALAVARAAGKAADGIEKVQSELRQVRTAAAQLKVGVNPVTNRLESLPGVRHSPADLQRIAELQARLNTIVAEADEVDAELAGAIDMADGDKPVPPGPHDNRPEIADALSKPLPDDPEKFNEVWNKLTGEEKDWLYSCDHSIGNHPGMPWDPADHLGKDHYDRLHLSELTNTAQADVDRLQHRVDELARQVYLGDHSAVTADELNAVAPRLLAARHSLDGYRATQATLDRKDGVNRYLGVIDDNGHAAIAIGNPDTARRNAVFVPGTGQDLARLPFSDDKSLAMYQAALRADPALKAGDVAVTTWLGYDRPMDLSHAAFPGPAHGGADGLDAFERGNRASHVGPPSIDTVIGHSYGSTLVGAAASGGHHLDADNVVAVGSPGVLVEGAGGLSLNPGAHVFAMRAGNDIIGLGRVATEWTLGGDPMAPNFGATRLAADPGPAGPVGLPSVDAHSSYWDFGNSAVKNLGAVIAGMPAPYAVGQR